MLHTLAVLLDTWITSFVIVPNSWFSVDNFPTLLIAKKNETKLSNIDFFVYDTITYKNHLHGVS